MPLNLDEIQRQCDEAKYELWERRRPMLREVIVRAFTNTPVLIAEVERLRTVRAKLLAACNTIAALNYTDEADATAVCNAAIAAAEEE